MNAPAKINPPANVYGKIAAVQGELAKVGISKSRRNSQQGYNFRGIDEVYAALSPLLAAHGLVIVPRVISRECVERQSAKGGALFNVTVHAEFDFISADDGSVHTAATYGEAMDSADKATNKAMSAAYKYAAFMTFAIPTEGDNDADATTHAVAVAGQGQSEDRKVSPAPKRENWGGTYPNKTALHRGLTAHQRDLEGCGDLSMLDALTATKEWREFVATAEEHAPHYLYGGEPAPEEFKGLLVQAKQMRDEFNLQTANHMVDLANT